MLSSGINAVPGGSLSMAARFPASEAAQNQATAGDRSEGL